MRSSIACTVGNSLRFQANKNEQLKEAFKQGKEAVLNVLRHEKDPVNSKIFGAEINSTASIVKRGYIDSLQNIYLFVSDTEEGVENGEILKRYFEDNPHGLVFNRAEIVVVKGLNHKNPHEFRTKGLRTLVQKLSERSKQNRENLIINATGGYKAQIAYAVALGQALKITVYYRFELFEHVVSLPPLPLKLSEEPYEANKLLFTVLDSFNALREKDLISAGCWSSFSQMPEEIKYMVERETVDDISLIALNAMGQIFVEGLNQWDNSCYENKIFHCDADKKPEDKIQRNNKHAQKIYANQEKLLTEIARLPWIERIVIKGSSEKYTANRVAISAHDNYIKLNVSTAKGTLHMEVFVRVENLTDRFLGFLKSKIEKIASKR